MRIPRLVAIATIAFGCCLFCSTAPAQTNVGYCQESDAVKKDFDTLPKLRDGEPYKAYRARWMTSLESLAKKYPYDLFVQNSWAKARRSDGKVELTALLDEYRALMEKRPTDPVPAYLYANLMVGNNTKEAIARLTTLLKASPEFPWPHWLLAQV